MTLVLSVLAAAVSAAQPPALKSQPAPAAKGQAGPKAPPPDQRAVADQIAELEQQVKALRSRVGSLSRRLPYDFASLDCNSKKYVEFQLDTSHLVFFAVCKSIEPYLEGHKVQISIGNPYSFNFRNVKGHLGYGKTTAEAVDQKVEISLTESVLAGSWHPITVIVNPSKAEDMRVM